MNRRRIVSLVAVGCSLLQVPACAEGPALRGKIRGLTTTVDDAEKNGAMKCAPRELAIARSQLEFAAIDLDQGQVTLAQAHLAKAEPNAQAAFDNSPPDRCTSREFVEVAKPEKKDQDTDGDGIMTRSDQCILEPEDKDGYLDDDGCPDPDNDADGIPDTVDKCPNEPEDIDGYQDDDGCPDPDNDGDGWRTSTTSARTRLASTGATSPGCPKKNSLIVVTENEIRITQQIQFEFNKASSSPGISFKILDEVAGVLNDNPKIALEVQGHTDNVGSDAYNMKLSQSRADSVRAYLVSKGIAPSRLVSKGYGFHQPLVAEHDRGQPRRSTAASSSFARRQAVVRSGYCAIPVPSASPASGEGSWRAQDLRRRRVFTPSPETGEGQGGGFARRWRAPAQ